MKKIYFLVLFFYSLSLINADEVSEVQKRRDTLIFGVESEITALIDTLIKEKDTSTTNDLLEVFNKTKNSTIREKLIEYFTINKNPSLEKYALDILSDPFDTKKSTVNQLFKYVAECKIDKAAPILVKLLDSENSEYFDGAISALGEVGGPEQALFLADFLDKDLSVPQKQALMKALGKINAVEIYDKLVNIAENKEENSYVRMYAAEAIGAMKKEEAVDVLVALFEEEDPNIRTYVIKGIRHFDNQKMKDLIIEAFRDNYYKVRLEAADTVKEKKIQEAFPSLLYRAKNDTETAVKYACYEALASLNNNEGNEYLLSLVKDSKKGDSLRAKAASALLTAENDNTLKEILIVVDSVLIDKKKTTLRYSIGKELVKYNNPLLEDICGKFLDSEDTATKGIGVDIWAKNQFTSLKEKLITLSSDEKQSSLSKKCKLILEQAGITVNNKNQVELENTKKDE